MSKKQSKPTRKPTAATATPQKAVAAKPARKWPILPVLPIFFLMAWAWAAIYYGTVLHVCREFSFWVKNTEQMEFLLTQSYGTVRYMGRFLLQLYRYPWLGGLFLAVLLTCGTWLVGYSLRLKARFRCLQYLPAFVLMGVLTYHGIDLYFEAETGYILGVPTLILLVLVIWSVMIRSFSRKATPAFIGIPKDETKRDNVLQLAVCIIGFAAVIGYNEWKRPYVRVISQLMDLQYDQKWHEMEKVARAHCTQSNRPMAAYYAIALVHTDQIADRMYDIRLDYDSLHVHGLDGYHNNGVNLYQQECNYHAGFILPAYHYCMEQMVMAGPNIRLLKLMVKCALMRNEWELADKYLRILSDVPFEGEFCKKYGALVRNTDLINADPEIADIRRTEPLRDSFENQYQQPTFMGYNLQLLEGRTLTALHHSLAVCLYTKLMPQFTMRLEPIYGSTPPEIIGDGILLASSKTPNLDLKFKGLDLRLARLQSFMQAMQPYMQDRAAHAEELFPKYKGYYPYYYFFGNLKATKKGYTGGLSSNSGVN